jgi:hypothetical protein
MRLLNVKTLELESFMSEIPAYAILSHTWLDADQEVTLQDIKHNIAKAYRKEGWDKVRASAAAAHRDRLKYIWIDTCCIDKTSSAELSEAINSMYRWYKEAVVCYAYLSDVSSVDSVSKATKWFSRGWTLQELIAPKEIYFYNHRWEHIGSRAGLEKVISGITQIPRSVLSGGSLSDVSVAAKLSWAAKRVTTRPEDMAYCLLGILDVNMPLLYGEGGKKAFIRLQEEFLRSQDDESIFAWTVPFVEGVQSVHHWSLLASSPACFGHVQAVTRPQFKSRIHHHPTTLTNRGISTELSLCPFEGDKSGTIYLGLLDCTFWSDPLAIILQRVSDIDENHYVRIAADLLVSIRYNFYHIPFSRLSPDYGREYYDADSKPSWHVGDTTEEKAFLRVSDPVPQLIVVRNTAVDAELLAGFYLSPEFSSDSLKLSDLDVIRIRTPPGSAWDEVKQYKLAGNEGKHYYMLSHANTDEDGRPDLRAGSLKARTFLGGLEFDVSCQHDATRVPAVRTLTLLVGLEPLPENPFGTPPLYVKPWYRLVPRPLDESFVPDVLNLGDIQAFNQQSIPNGLCLRIRFSTGMRYEKLLYRTEFVATPSGWPAQ